MFMLSYNSVVFVLKILFIIVMLPFLLYICAKGVAGYYQVRKNQIQNVQLEKMYFGFQNLIIVGIMLVFLVIWPPVLLDIPEYFSGTGKIVNGTITEFIDGNKSENGEWTLVSVKVRDEITEKIISIENTYFPYAEVGDQVKISYLQYCKMGTVLEINGTAVSTEQKVNRGFFITVMILVHLYFIVRMLLVLKEKIKQGKRFKVHIYKAKCIICIFALEIVSVLGSIILVAAMVGYSNFILNVSWIILLVSFYILLFILFIEDHYVLKVNRRTIFYCGRKDKYSGDIKEIKEIEKIGKRIDIILENGNRLPIYDIEENSLS